jgi:hypothetical protein
LAKRQATDFLKWATLGAGQRLRELREEITSIYRAFPGLRSTQGRRSAKGSRGPRATGATANTGKNAAGRPKRRRRKMSAEARKRISDAQKARWAKQRAEAATPGGARKKR